MSDVCEVTSFSSSQAPWSRMASRLGIRPVRPCVASAAVSAFQIVVELGRLVELAEMLEAARRRRAA